MDPRLFATTIIGVSELHALVTVLTRRIEFRPMRCLPTDKARVSRIVLRKEEKFGASLLNRSSRRLTTGILDAAGQIELERVLVQ